MLRHRFGRRSEHLSPDQLLLAMENVEQEIAEQEAAKDNAEQSEDRRRAMQSLPPRRRRADGGHL